MLRSHRWVVAAPMMVGLCLEACQRVQGGAPALAKPAQVERIEGSDASRVTLTRRAAERLDVKTDVVREMRVARSGAMRKVVPYAAVLYDAQGSTWVYTSPEPLVFVRQRIVIDYIAGDVAVLSDGPPAGTIVVTVGAAELFGTEFEVGH